MEEGIMNPDTSVEEAVATHGGEDAVATHGEEDAVATHGEEGACLVCLVICDTKSNDLFLYNCTCIYPVHPECFRNWRNISKTDMICMICRKEIESYDTQDQLADVQVVRYEQRRARDIENNCAVHCVKNILYIFIIFSLFSIVFLMTNVCLHAFRSFKQALWKP